MLAFGEGYEKVVRERYIVKGFAICLAVKFIRCDLAQGSSANLVEWVKKFLPFYRFRVKLIIYNILMVSTVGLHAIDKTSKQVKSKIYKTSQVETSHGVHRRTPPIYAPKMTANLFIILSVPGRFSGIWILRWRKCDLSLSACANIRSYHRRFSNFELIFWRLII